MSISSKIAKKISSELKLDQDNYEVINYGAFAFFQVIFSLVLVALFGFLFGVLFEALVVSFITSILRMYSGGAHASRPGICIIIGTIATVGIAVLSSWLSGYLNLVSTVLIGAFCLIWSYYIIFKYAPVESKAKPIKTLAKRKRMKKYSTFVITIYFLIVCALIIAYYVNNNKVNLKYSVCIYGGIIWQAFNLTIIGNKILNRVDRFFYRFLYARKEVIE